MPAAISVSRSLIMRGVCWSSGSPTHSTLRSGEMLRTTPGSITWLDEVMTPPRVRSKPTVLSSAPPGSSRDRSGAFGRSLPSPWPYHQGMPFCAKTTGVSGPSSGVTVSATADRLEALRVEITTSCGPRSAGLSLAATLATIFLSPVRSVRPLARIASRWGPRATTETSLPAAARRVA